MSAGESGSLNNPPGAASYFNNGVQEFLQEDPGRQQPDLVAPGNVGSNQQSGYHNTGEFAGAATNQPVFYNPAELKNHAGQEQYQGHSQHDNQINEQWNYVPHADPSALWHHQDMHQQNPAANVQPHGQVHGPSSHMFYQQPGSMNNEFESPQQQTVGENVAQYGNGQSNFLQNYPGNMEQADRYAAVSSGGDPHPSLGQFAKNEPNLDEPQPVRHVDEPLPHGEEYRTCGKSVPDIVSYSKDGNILLGQEYTDVVPMQQHQQHNWLETHGTGVSVIQPGSEAHNLQPFENMNCNNLDLARSPSAQEGLDFGRSEPDLAPQSEIHGEPVRFEPDRVCPDLGMSCNSPLQHSDPGLPGEFVPQGGADHEDIDKRSEQSGSRSSSMIGLSVSESSHSGQHSRSSSLIGEASSDIQQHHPPEHLHTSLGDPTGTQEPVNIPEEIPINDNSHQLQTHLEPSGLATVINKEISSPDPTSVLKSSGESICASILEQDKIDHRSTDQEKNNTANSSSLSSHSYPAVGQVAEQYIPHSVHFQPSTATSTATAFAPENKEDDKISENCSPSDMRMRHKSTEEVDHLVQGGAHPSAFTTVKGRGGAVVQNRIMPSPPLWSTEVPALPSNILLTAASPAQIIKPVLPATGIPTSIPGPAPLPIVFSSTSQTSVAQPTAVLGSTNQTIASSATVTESNPPTTAFVPSMSALQTVPSPEIPQTAPQPFVANAMVNVAPPKPLPAPALGVQAPTSLEYAPGHPITQPPVPLSLPSGLSSQPQPSSLASHVTQGVANMSLGSERPQMSAAQPANLQQYPGTQNNAAVPHQGFPPYAQYPEGYAQPGGIQQGRQRAYPQYPPHQGPYPQGHIPERSTSRGPYAGYGNAPYDFYGQPYDPYAGYRYGQAGYSRSYYEDYYYRQQEYARRRYSGARRYPESYQAQYENARPRSRQDTESPGSSNSEDRPNSRQERSRDERDNYSREGYSRRGYDEYGRPIAYDRARHRNSYYSRGYQYDSYQEQEYKRMQQEYYNEYYRSQHNTSRGLSEQKQEPSTSDSSFASNFHHTGGNTPERYNQDMSSINASVDSNYYQFETNQDVSQQVSAESASYSTGYIEDSSWTQPEVQEAPPPRRTPTKFSLPHILGRFSPGGHLVKVLANAPGEGATATVEIHSIEAMLDHTAESQELRSFPGPLISNETHKGDVINFASKKVKSYREDTSAIDKDSATLLWELMLTLCRLNGTVVGQDISELILKNHPVLGSEETEEVDTSDVSSSTPTNLKLTHPKKSVDVEKETLRFRELLLFGRKKDALENAIKSGLWGHALLLACKMDHRTHASVMTRFANSLPMNDPLQTLYQLMSNRQPAAVTSCSDVKWGDWRPHLAMILSNLGSNAELDKKSIITLGDSLGSRGLVHASHFCYLMVQLGLGTYSKKSSKMVLIGSSHGLPFNEFATNEAIQQTEVYEFAQHLANKHYTMPNYNAYKFIYACRLAEHGFITQALHYCEVIAKSIIFLPTHYSETLVSQVCQMSDRLKYHDVQYFDGRELTQPQWLKDLEGIQQQIMDGSIQPASNPETPMPWVESFTNLSNLAETEDTESTPSTQYEPLPSHEEQQIPGMDNQGFYQPADFQENQNVPTQYNQDPAPGGGGHFYQPSNQEYAGYDSRNTYGNQHTSPLASMNVDPGASLGSTISEYSSTATEDDTEWTNSNASNFDYYGATTYSATTKGIDTPSTIPSTPSKTITPPESPRTRTLSQSSTNKGSTPTPVAKQKPQQKHSEQNSTVKPKSGGGSWFRGLFSRFGGKNDVHLPDDSDKTIEWDEKKQKWVNKDSDGDDNDGIVAPPPSDSQLSQTAPSSALPPTSAASVNKFSKKHVGRNYVDFVKQQSGTVSSAAPPAALFPTIPNSSAPPVNFFMPTPASTTNSESQPQVGNPGSQPSTPASEHSDLSPASHQPQFFNPNSYNNPSITMGQFQGYNNTQVQSQEPSQPVEENLSRTSSMSDLSQEVSQHLGGQGQSDHWDSTASAEPAMPMMFNPQQFSQQSFQPPMMQPSPSAAGPSSRAYRQRRQYPSQK